MALIWPTNYVEELARRMELERRIAADPVMLAGAKALYKASFPTFVADCCWVYEPRNAPNNPVRVPVVPFPRQREFCEWLVDHFQRKKSDPVEKSRDSGATWIASCFAVWLWLFHEDTSCGFGSRKEDLVDRAGDMQSIFEKIRSLIRNLPPYLKPEGLKEKVHFNHMRIVHPMHSGAIVGEAGDNIGRGGRTSIYFIDESAFLERPQLVEASLSATTDVRIDISTPSVGSVFDTWCSVAPERFIFDVSDAPWHTKEWMQGKKEEMENKGLGHLYRREFLRDGTAGLPGQLIDALWIEAAVGAAEKLGIKPTGIKRAALDPADGGQDRSAVAMRHGVECFYLKSRGDLLADGAGSWAYFEAMEQKIESLFYDSVGVGAGAAASLRDKKVLKVRPWAGSASVVDPTRIYGDIKGGRTNEDMFANAKAQAWWMLRDRFILTYKVIVEGKRHLLTNPDDIISLHPDMPELRELKTELAQIKRKENRAGKTEIDKSPDGRPSPNRADAVMMAFAPEQKGVSLIGVF